MPKKKLSPQARSYKNRYIEPLFAAVADNKEDIFKELIEEDPTKTVKAINSINTPILYYTFLYRRPNMAKILLDNGADPNTIGHINGHFCLIIVHAIAATNQEFTKLLASHGASLDKEVEGLSAQKILEQPQAYVKKFFGDDTYCPGAQKFLREAEEINQFILQIRSEMFIQDNEPSQESFVRRLIKYREHDSLLRLPKLGEDEYDPQVKSKASQNVWCIIS